MPKFWRLRTMESFVALPVLNAMETRAWATEGVGTRARIFRYHREPLPWRTTRGVADRTGVDGQSGASPRRPRPGEARPLGEAVECRTKVEYGEDTQTGCVAGRERVGFGPESQDVGYDGDASPFPTPGGLPRDEPCWHILQGIFRTCRRRSGRESRERGPME